MKLLHASSWTHTVAARSVNVNTKCKQHGQRSAVWAKYVPNSTTRTPATDMLYNITNGRAHNNSTTCCIQQIHQQRPKICHIPTSWHIEMLGSGIAMWQTCCCLGLTADPKLLTVLYYFENCFILVLIQVASNHYSFYSVLVCKVIWVPVLVHGGE